jgi:hypothetical protein
MQLILDLKSRSLIYCFFLFIGFLLQSCAPVLYMPGQLNMPMASGSKNGKVALYASSSGWGAEGSYALDSHIVVLADGQYSNSKLIGSNKVYSFNAGLGYFASLNGNDDSPVTLVSLEFMTGLGYGRADVNISYAKPLDLANARERDILNGYYYRYFAQTDLVIKSKQIRIGFGIRFCDMMPKEFNYRIITTVNKTGTSGSSTYVVSDEKLNTLQNTYAIEPALNIMLKLSGGLYMHTSFCLSLNSYKTDSRTDFQSVYSPYIISAGISYFF